MVNVLIGFGVLAAAAVAMVPNPLTGVVLGGVLMAIGLGLGLSRQGKWTILANICSGCTTLAR